MSESKKVLFIINKYSGTGYRSEVEDKILSHCDKLNIGCKIEFTKEPGHAIALAKSAVEQNYTTVFAVGGDGTVNEVAQSLVGTNISMGIIPKGSGNGLARHLQIPLNLDKALDLIDSRTIAIDTFTINDKLSVNVSGIGFDGHVANLFGNNSKRGFLNYLRIVVQEFINFSEFTFTIKFEGKESQGKSFIIAIANSSQYGNNASIAPGASVCDALLDICFVKKMSVFQAVGFLKGMFLNELRKSSFVDFINCDELTVNTQQPVTYHVDGEAAGAASTFNLKIQPASLLIKVPHGPASRLL